ncbi:MAG: acyltransferase [Candidatus Sericytochromatia bacterium]
MRIPAFLLGSLTAGLIGLNTLFWVLAFVPFILLKLLPIPQLRHFSSLALIRCAEIWVAGNSRILSLTPPITWRVEGIEGLDPRASYLLISNHQSWVDIFVLQHLFHGKIPFLKFFLKQELIWVPLLGLAWWALDFPFMKRYSRAELEKHPELRGKDVETTRQHCEKFRQYPVTVINFLEGTRRTPSKQAKHAAQGSPYQHLLRPKAGGVALVVAAMGDRLSAVLDVTIRYPGTDTKKLFWKLLSGQIPAVEVHIRSLPMPAGAAGRDYLSDPAYQQQMQDWVNQLWADKDALIASRSSAGAAAPDLSSVS